jgi:hypothetical protein
MFVPGVDLIDVLARVRADELIAAEADQKIIGPDVVPDGRGDCFENPVPRRVALRVVSRLEAHRVDEGEDQLLAGPFAAVHLAADRGETSAPTHRAGEVVQAGVDEVAAGRLAGRPRPVSCPSPNRPDLPPRADAPGLTGAPSPDRREGVTMAAPPNPRQMRRRRARSPRCRAPRRQDRGAPRLRRGSVVHPARFRGRQRSPSRCRTFWGPRPLGASCHRRALHRIGRRSPAR